MAKKTKRGRKVAKRSKSRAGKLLARIGAKVSAARAKTKATVRRTLRKTAAKKHSAADQLARNKQLVLAFYHKMIGEKDYEGARQYMGEEYRQHAPYATDGHAGIAEWVRKFKEAFPQHRYELKKIIAEGDLVVLHLHGMNGPNPHGESVVDIFRIKNGKVVEHWDVIHPIPETADNANTMF